jgi:uncharacterized membrane protein YbaN (DUF454 family)
MFSWIDAVAAERTRADTEQVNKTTWIIGRTIYTGLGVLGGFLPVLPTTPFLLLVAFCFGRVSEEFPHWLVHRSWIGGYIRNYQSDMAYQLGKSY